MAEERTDTLELPAGTKRLVVLGDPHGDFVGLAEVFARENRPGTQFISVGDNIGYADAVISSQFCRVLKDRKIPSVLGNHEDWSSDGTLFLTTEGGPRQLDPDALAWLRALPFRLRIEVAGLVVHVVHTLPQWAYVTGKTVERFAAIEGAADIVFCGHTHSPAIYTLRSGEKPKVRRLKPESEVPISARLLREPRGTRFIVDAGSLARPHAPTKRIEPLRGTYASFDIEDRTLTVSSFDKKKRLDALKKKWLEKQQGLAGGTS